MNNGISYISFGGFLHLHDEKVRVAYILLILWYFRWLVKSSHPVESLVGILLHDELV